MKSQDVKKILEIFGFLDKRPLTVKFSKFCYKSFQRDIDRRVVLQFREILAEGKSVKSCVDYLTKNKFRLAQ